MSFLSFAVVMILANQEPLPALVVSDVLHFRNLFLAQLVLIFHGQTILSNVFHPGSLVGSCVDL